MRSGHLDAGLQKVPGHMCARGAWVDQSKRPAPPQCAALSPPHQGKGPAASAVRDMLLQLRRESPPPPPPPGGARIGRVILLDREADVVTPLLTQITFEGLIDEVTGIKHGAAPLPSSAGEGACQGTRTGGSGGASRNRSSRVARRPHAITWARGAVRSDSSRPLGLPCVAPPRRRRQRRRRRRRGAAEQQRPLLPGVSGPALLHSQPAVRGGS